jgi:GAF domain-containing protein
MSKAKGSGTSFVDRVREDASRYLQELLSENERLRNGLADLEGEHRRLVAERDAAQRALDFERTERTTVDERLEIVERENESYLAQFVTVQEEIGDLANLYIAASRLAGTLDRAKVVAAVEEIIINIVGSEELALFELDGKELALVSSFGVEQRELMRVRPSGILGKVVQSAEAYIPLGDELREELVGIKVNACVPLTIDGKVTGAIVVFRLLQQKARLTESDVELLSLLGTHAATALYVTKTK